MFGIFVRHNWGFDGEIDFQAVCQSKKEVRTAINKIVKQFEGEGFVIRRRSKNNVAMEMDDEEVFVFVVPVGEQVTAFAE